MHACRYLLSQLEQSGRCPGFLRLYSAFRSASPPPDEGSWGQQEEREGAELGDDDDDGHSDDELAEQIAISEQMANLELSLWRGEVAAEADAGNGGGGGGQPPPPGRKPRKPTAVAKRPNANAPCFQYVLMEFADGGDLEEGCKRQPRLMFGVERLPCLLFQMLFSLYSAQV